MLLVSNFNYYNYLLRFNESMQFRQIKPRKFCVLVQFRHRTKLIEFLNKDWSLEFPLDKFNERSNDKITIDSHSNSIYVQMKDK